ncbi:MAG: hypothetical protein PUF72_11905 [Clostridiales bacterium]|nr:hypothetical protein [Clostridiales bacterium]
MKKLSIFAVCICSALAMTSCGMNNNANPTNSPEATSAASAAPTHENGINDAVNDVTDGAGNVVDDAGNIVEDAGQAVGDAAEGVGNAARDMVQ